MKTRWCLSAVLTMAAVVLVFPQLASALPNDDDFSLRLRLGYYASAPAAARISADGTTVYGAGLPVMIVDNRDPSHVPARIPAPQSMLTRENATASFTITYVPAGGTDEWTEPCYEYPAAAKTAFEAAAAVWANTVQSSVPISIVACWANLGSSSTLGYAGGSPLRRDFTGAPVSNTWYNGSLANSRAGSDLDPSDADMHITYNNQFSWYFGTDGATPTGQHDFMTVALHEIAHGLNFAGSMTVANGLGTWGYGTSYPNAWDRFVKDGSGTDLINTTSYPKNSTTLAGALTSNNIWFHGPYAMAANGGTRVKLYAPGTWAPGSSYSHLDYTTFNETANELMVYAVSSGESIHKPGDIAIGLLKGLGWVIPSPATAQPFLERRSDFNGDGKSDMTWRNQQLYETHLWMMNGTAIGSGGVLPAAGSSWKRLGTGDLNGDGKADLMWRYSSGEAHLWFMNGATMTSGAVMPGVSNDWTLSGIGDFNNDGKDDLVWTHTSGATHMWLMNGASISSGIVLAADATAWDLVATGDLNGDGKDDLIWRNKTNYETHVWFMNGGSIQSGAVLPAAGSGWSLKLAGDFNGDGKDDLLWRYTSTNETHMWFMNGATISSGAVLPGLTTSWTLVHAGDYNADGKLDLVWRYTTGEAHMWLMNGGSIQSGAVLPGISSVWTTIMEGQG